MHYLIQEPNYLRCLSAVVKFKKHFYAFKEEWEVKIWGNQALLGMNVLQPGGYHLHSCNYRETVVDRCLLEHYSYEVIKKPNIR